MSRIASEDIEKVILLCVFTPLSWLLPNRYWPALTLALAQASGLLLRGRRQALEHDLPEVIVELSGKTERDAVAAFIAGCYEETLGLLREHRPGGWQPDIRLFGRQHVDNALAAGSGAVLWVTEFSSAVRVSAIAFKRAGFKPTGLFRPEHGIASTPLAVRFLNRVQLSIEDRYGERITMHPGETIGSLRTLRRRLAQNALIGTMVSENARQTVTVPLFDGRLRVASGTVTLARASGAPLLPIFTIRDGRGGFEVHVEGPLPVSRSKEDAAPYEEYARLLELYVRRDPTSWRGWQAGWLPSKKDVP